MISQEQGSAHGSLRSRINPNLSIDVQNANRQGAGDIFNIIPQDNSHMDPAAGSIGMMSYPQAVPVQSVPVQPQAQPMSQPQAQQQPPSLPSQHPHLQLQASSNQQPKQSQNPDPAQSATDWPGHNDDPAAMILESMRKSPRPGFDDISIQNNEEATRTMVALAKWVRELRKNSPEELNRNFELVSMLKELNSLTSIALNISHTELLPSSNPSTPMSANANRNIHEYYYDRFVPATPNSPYYNFPTPGSVQSQPIATSPGLVSPRSYNPPWNMYSTPSTPLYNVPPSPNTPSQLSYLSIYGSPRGRRKSKFGISKMITCKQCGTDKTPEWRRGPDGPRTLCNACGLQHRKHQKLYGEEEANRIHRSKSQ